MQTRACLSSASRAHWMGTTSDRRMGSKPLSPAMVPSRAAGASRNGMAFDLAIMTGEPARWATPESAGPVKDSAAAESDSMDA
eukprot:scaffold13785_cov93-Isochrysis_galbana.AAC.1